MPVQHKIFVEDIMNLLLESENENPEEIMNAIMRIVDDYKSELSLEETESQSLATMAMLSETTEKVESGPPKASGQTKRAFLLNQAKQKFYKENGFTEEDEASFSITEKADHREEINKIFYELLLKDEEEESPTNLKGTPFLLKGKVRRASEDEELPEATAKKQDRVANKWKKEQISKINREIKTIESEIEALSAQNKMPRVSQSVVARNEEEIERLEADLEELEERKEQYL